MTLITKKQKKHPLTPTPPNTPLPLAIALTDDVDNKKREGDINGEEFVYHDYSEDGLHVSEDIYWKYYYEHPYFNYEWNNGVLEEKTVSTIDTYRSFDWLTNLLKEFLKHHPIAETFSQEIGGRIHLPHKTLVRRPDLWVLLHSNPVSAQGHEVSYKGTFDICIEAISKTKEEHKERDTIIKKKEYALSGVKEYYIIDADGTETVFYWLNEQKQYEEIPSTDGIIRSAVLPGFQFKLSHLYKTPPIEDLRHDEIYKHFVSLGWQEAEQRATIEAQARQSAEAEVERLKALLKNVSQDNK